MGPQGVAGPVGPVGPAGIPGPSGAPGVAGITDLIAYDSFVRADQPDWGVATDGEVWTLSGGTATLSIASNTGVVTGSASGVVWAQLGSATCTDSETLVRVSCTSATNTIAGILLRDGDTGMRYYCFLQGAGASGSFQINSQSGSTVATVVTAPVTIVSGGFAWIRVRVIGSNFLAKTWAYGTDEPTSWTLTGTDVTYAGAGTFGLVAYAAGTDTVTFDHFSVRALPGFTP